MKLPFEMPPAPGSKEPKRARHASEELPPRLEQARSGCTGGIDWRTGLIAGIVVVPAVVGLAWAVWEMRARWQEMLMVVLAVLVTLRMLARNGERRAAAAHEDRRRRRERVRRGELPSLSRAELEARRLARRERQRLRDETWLRDET